MLLELVDLYVKYGNIEVLHGINLEVREGELLAVIGPNGGGKTTLLKLILGLLRPESGSIRARVHGFQHVFRNFRLVMIMEVLIYTGNRFHVSRYDQQVMADHNNGNLAVQLL